MSNKKILYVDDDQRLCRLIRRYLERADFQVSCATNGEAMHQLLEAEQFNLILLDIMLPDKDGLSLAREVRNTSSIPIIFLTARADVNDKVNGFETGADDYVTKPFEEKELLMRIQSVLRRAQPESDDQRHKGKAHFAGWTLNYVNQTLLSPNQQNVDITSCEFRMLSALVNRPDKAISRIEILKIISGREWSPLDRSADMAISKLRRKIEDNPKKPAIIRTIRNKGYQLTATVDYEETDT